MNFFFAVQPSEEVREAVAEAARQWKGALGSLPKPFAARWYDPADYHVTLNFLGDLVEVNDALILAGMAASEKTASFNVTLNGMGAFPDLAMPRVLWLGAEPNVPLSELASCLGAVPESADLRPYLPHLTVARCNPSRHYGIHIPYVKERAFGTFVVDRLVLMQTLPPGSRAIVTKARYNTVHTFPFGNKQISDV